MKKLYITYLLFFCFSALSIYLLPISFINLDSANALYEAKLMLSGGQYFYQFFETSPPMFLYVFLPLAFIIKSIPSIRFDIGIYYYFYILSLISFFLCYVFSNLIFQKQSIKQIIFLSSIAFLFLISGELYFGQREQIALIFTLPYFLLLVCRLEKRDIRPTVSFIIGIIAGIGFAAKPHFCIPFFLAELYFMLKNKRFLSAFRIESITVFSLFVVYLVSTYFLYPAYFHIIVPLSEKFYYFGIDSDPFWKNFFTIKMGYCYVSLLFYFVLQDKPKQLQTLIDVMVIALVGYVLSYVSELVPWDYHLFPAYAFCLFLNTLLFLCFAEKNDHNRFRNLLYFLFALFTYLYNMLYTGIHPLYSIFLASFCIFFYLKRFIFESIFKALSMMALAGLVFSYPIYVTYISYQSQITLRKTQKPIIDFLNQNAFGKPVYFLTSILSAEYPTVDYAGALHCSRFPYLMWMPAYIKAASEHREDQHAIALYKLNTFFMQLVAKDIAEKKPEFILVDTSKYIITPTYTVSGFDYLKLFLTNPTFKSVWKKYHYDTTIDHEPSYKLTVYQLNSQQK